MNNNLLSKESKVLLYLYNTFGDKIKNEYCEVLISDVGSAVLGSNNNIMFLFYCLKSDDLIDCSEIERKNFIVKLTGKGFYYARSFMNILDQASEEAFQSS